MGYVEKDLELGEDILEAFQRVAPYLNRLIQDDITIGIYDTKKLLLNIPGETFALDVHTGDPLAPGDIITDALRENRDKSAMVPKELFGFPLIARAIPLHDENGKVVGGVGVGTSLKKSNDLFLVADSLSAIFEETAASLDEIADSVSKLADQVAEASGILNEVTSGAAEIGKISSVVREISDQSNLLGLNAAIEAARAGDYGKGFSVVAQEIRKLATNSKENVGQINNVTKYISQSVERLNTAFSSINEVTTNQAASIQEISATVQEISRNAQNLSELAENNLRN
ncbi:archaellum component FlaC [Filibacter limicola]|uniref:Archaellum component FlaC n=1 Tax=Sporosarcina limicola TaxID=34101 RepID=A0A927MHZ4_9BACL|nr:methyl-accepting chemotaxis protein [Sporosarcina limicola]MBE1553362.1 archaellum component FlaC [Sporosarcina limicola]